MPRNFDLGDSLNGLNGLGRLDWRDPRVFMRAILALLLLATLVALYFLFFPPGGSLEDLERRYLVARESSVRQARNLERVRSLAAKVQVSRSEGERFLDSYFMDRRKAASTIVTELSNLAKEAGIRPKEHSFLLEPVEGSEDLIMMTVNGAYEGTYADLIQFINRIDRSPRFLIIDNLSAAPQQQAGILNISIRFHVFVREARS
jgi:Tfp pilus assembly protein PilO